MRRTTTRGVANRVGVGFSRAVVTKTDVDPKLQQADLGMFASEASTGVEVAYPYGFAARVHGPMEKDGATRHAESYVVTATGARSHPVALPPSDRRHPAPVKLKEGEVVYHDDQGQWVHLGRDRTHVRSPKMIVHEMVDGDGKSVSTVTQDKDGKVTIANKHGASLVLDGPNITIKPGQGGKIKQG